MTFHPFSSHPDNVQFEAYLLGHLEPGMRDALESHVDGCAACFAALERVRAAIAELSTFLQLPTGGAPAPCLDEWTLAAFLDNQLAPQERNSTLAHLAACLSCRKKLLGMHETVQDIRVLEAEASRSFGAGLGEPAAQLYRGHALEQSDKNVKAEARNPARRKISEK